MLNIHLNGDIVRCPDMAAIQKRVTERKEKSGICKYNQRLCDCEARKLHISAFDKWHDSNICKIQGSEFCPGRRIRTDTGTMQKNYKINTAVYRKMASATHDLVKSSPKNESLFLTLTFPPFKIVPDEKQINECFSKFMENLRRNYGCSGYVAVREYGDITNRVHFHAVCAMPYNSFIIINRAWCRAISAYCDFSPSALRTTKQSLYIKSPVKAVKYICKYFSKSRGVVSKTKLYFISNNLIRRPLHRPYNVNELLQGYKGIYINQSSDYTTVYRVTDERSFMRFCHEFLYDEFEKEYNYPLFNKQCTNLRAPKN